MDQNIHYCPTLLNQSNELFQPPMFLVLIGNGEPVLIDLDLKLCSLNPERGFPPKKKYECVYHVPVQRSC